ncbi:glycosyltransferase [Marimonas sp. MJW-29]|uniref:Glycosyltransferase n=1 Tax=Sulfitobacter sediminis TaxID=3234186 RepID=A0ABV3RNS6_9RHOB
MVIRLDICVLADIRVGDVAAPCHAAALDALADRGYRVGILPVVAEAIAADPFAVHPDHERLFKQGRVTRLSPDADVDCTLALAFDSRLFSSRLSNPALITSKMWIVTVERPFDLANLSRRELEKVAFSAEMALGGKPLWAPSTIIARDALTKAAPDWSITDEDWSPVVPRAEGQRAYALETARPNVGMTRIARARASVLVEEESNSEGLFGSPFVAWKMRGGPEMFQLAWPQRSPVELWPDDRISIGDFLARIDLLANADIAANDPCPVEALIAMQAGVIPFLDPEYRSTFGGAALYGDFRQLPRVAMDFHGDRGFAEDLRANMQSVLETTFSAERFSGRVATLIGPPRTEAFAPSIQARPARSVIFYSSNGVGMGHLTRQLAVARRLPGRFSPVFISHSQAVDTVRGFGYPVEYIPYHLTYNEAFAHWNAALTEALTAAIGFYRPAVVVFDGNTPFVGLMAALDRAPGVARIWIRRGMWAANRDFDVLQRGEAFDLVVEPNEVAPELDDGPTSEHRQGTLCVPPIHVLDSNEQLDREAACRALGLDPGNVNALVAPGSGNNFDTGRIAEMAVARLANRPGLGIVLAEWQIAERAAEIPATIPRLSEYPFARFHKAFDFAIAAAGYNTFTEHMVAALPTIWVPNENAQQDQQILRAIFARDTGLGACLRTSEHFNLVREIEAMLDSDKRKLMRARGMAFAERSLTRNGAENVAEAIAALCTTALSRRAS